MKKNDFLAISKLTAYWLNFSGTLRWGRIVRCGNILALKDWSVRYFLTYERFYQIFWCLSANFYPRAIFRRFSLKSFLKYLSIFLFKNVESTINKLLRYNSDLATYPPHTLPLPIGQNTSNRMSLILACFHHFNTIYIH